MLQVRLQQCRAERDNPFPHPAGNAVFTALNGTVGLPGCLSTLLTHVQFDVDRDPQIPDSKTVSHSQSVRMFRVDPPQVQNLALVLVIRHVVGGCLDLYLVRISLLVLSTLSGGNSFIQVSIVSRLAQNILWSYMQVIDENF